MNREASAAAVIPGQYAPPENLPAILRTKDPLCNQQTNRTALQATHLSAPDPSCRYPISGCESSCSVILHWPIRRASVACWIAFPVDTNPRPLGDMLRCCGTEVVCSANAMYDHCPSAPRPISGASACSAAACESRVRTRSSQSGAWCPLGGLV